MTAINSTSRRENNIRIELMKSEIRLNMMRTVCLPFGAAAAVITITIALTKMFL